MGIVFKPNSDLDALQAELDALPTPVEPVRAVMSPQDMYNQGAARQDAIDSHNKALEDHDASILGAAWGSWRFNTGFGALGESLLDQQIAGPEDPEFNFQDNLEIAAKTLPQITGNEYQYLKTAKNRKHFNMLTENLSDKRAFEFNNQALGVPLSIAAGLFAELGNPINYVPALQFAGLRKVSAIKVGLAQGALNVAEEKLISEVGPQERTYTDYLMAYTFGAGMGAGTTLLSRSIIRPDELTRMPGQWYCDTPACTLDTIDTLDRVVNGRVQDKTLMDKDIQKNGEYPTREYIKASEKDQTVYVKDNPDKFVDTDEPVKLSTEDQVHIAADNRVIDQEAKLPQGYIGLESMAHSLLSSKNKLTRYVANEVLEHGEKSGFKQQTAALEADQLVDSIMAPYAKSKVTLQGAWAKEAKDLGYTAEDFNVAATNFIDGNKQFLPNSTKEMNEIMAEFTELYKNTNGRINKEARESGVEEFIGSEHLDDLHLYRSYDLEAFHRLTTKYSDKGKAVKNTLEEAVRRGNYAEFSKKIDTEANIDAEIKAIAEAIYNRMLKRATVNTADANLLSSGNQRLLKDALADVTMSAADRKHIMHVLETQGRDVKANPMAQQIKMDLSTEVGDIKISDLLHTNLDANFLQKAKYWLGRSALARKGDHFASERSIQETLDAVKKESTNAGQTLDEIKADSARLDAGIRMVLGQSIEDMDAFGTKAMRNVRRLVGLSGLGKLGIVQYGEGGRAIAAKGVSQAMLMPEIAKLTRDITTGRMNSAALKDIEDFSTGQLDARIYLNHPDFRSDEFGAKVSKTEKMLDQMSFFMTKASGWNRVHRMQTAYCMDGLSQKWYRDVMNDTFKETQMDDLGITGLDVRSIKAQMKRHATPAEGRSEGSQSVTLNLSKWSPDVRRQFGLMLHRKSKNAVQDIMAGETPLWMNTTVGKFMAQFRSFSVAALAKQTTRDFKMLKQGDIEGAIMTEFMIATSTLATLAKIGYKSVGYRDKERKEYLDRELSPAQFLTSVLTYTGTTSGLIDLGSTVSSNLLGVNLAGQRVYRADGISGLTPGVQYIDKAVRGTVGVLSAPIDGFNKADARAIQSVLPLNTLWGIDVITKQGIINNIPE